MLKSIKESSRISGSVHQSGTEPKICVGEVKESAVEFKPPTWRNVWINPPKKYQLDDFEMTNMEYFSSAYHPFQNNA